MTEEKFYQRHALRLFAALMMLLFPLLGIMPGATAQAAASQQSTINNPAYTLRATDGAAVSTKANPNETTVLIFGHTGCSYTRSTLNSVSSCDWVKRSDIRVIFADCNLNSLENVQAYEQGYQCPDITFCYDDESQSILQMMYEYKRLTGLTSNKLPMIVLIDKDNKVQNILTNQKTADEILTEIKKFADVSGEGTTTPPSGSDSGIENFAFGLKTIDDTIVSTKADPSKTTVLLFGDINCTFTNATMKEIHESSWASRQDIRIMFADVQGNTLADTKTFAEKYSGKGIIFCHDESMLNFNFALSYLKQYNYTGGSFPYIVLIDKNNRIRNLTLGFQSAGDIYSEIEKILKEETSNPGETQQPQTPATISDVTGLKISKYADTSVKLSWKKVSKAKGYIIYQYNSAKKKWLKKTTVTKNTASYTIKKLTPGTAYRFAVKAYIQPEGSKQIVSKSYSSLYAATAPKAVNFKVTPGKKKATVTWTKVKGATGYTVYYKTKSQKAWKKLKTTKNARYTKTKLKSGATYTFTVKAYKTYKGKTYTSSFKSKKIKVK